MIPGESSSPESSLRQASRLNELDSDGELQQLTQLTPQPRSATIGADTPPTVSAPIASLQSSVNRHDVIGGSNDDGQDTTRTRGSGNLADDVRPDKNTRKLGK